jgi:hypothetical protein
MNEFIAKHAEGIAGVLSGFDRLVFRRTLRPISYPETGRKAIAALLTALRSTVRQLLPEAA